MTAARLFLSYADGFSFSADALTKRDRAAIFAAVGTHGTRITLSLSDAG
jgi:hypothetical protein